MDLIILHFSLHPILKLKYEMFLLKKTQHFYIVAKYLICQLQLFCPSHLGDV